MREVTRTAPKMSPDQVRKEKAMLLDPCVTKGTVVLHSRLTGVTLNKPLASEVQMGRI